MGQIRADLQLNCERFLGAIKQVDGAVAGFQKRVVAFTGSFVGLAAAGALITSQFTQVKKALDMGGELSDLSANTGQGIADLVVLRQAFENAGLGAEGVGPTLAKLQKALSGLNEEGLPTKAAFDKLGVSIHALRAMTATEQLTTLGAAFRRMPQDADRAKAAMDLFGGSGRKILALLMDTSAFSTARAQTGELAETMEKNAATFDGVSDAIGALHLKFEQFYSGLASGIAGNAVDPLKALSEIDFSEAGKSVGEFARDVGTLIGWLVKLSPLLAGVGAQMALNSAVARAAGTQWEGSWRLIYQAPIARLSALRTQLATTGSSFTTFAAQARAGMASAATSVVAGAKAMWAALGPGLAISAATATFAFIQNWTDQLNQGMRAMKDIGKESKTSTNANLATIGSVSNENEREQAMTQFDAELATVQERLRSVSQDYEHLTDSDRAKLTEQFGNWIAQIEASKRSLSKLSPELMAARAEANRLVAAQEEAVKAADKLRESVAKGFGELDKLKADDAFGALPALEQRAQLLRDAGKASEGAVDSELRWFDLVMKRRPLSDEEAARAAKLLDIRKQLVKTERDITNEKQKQQDEADDKAKKAAQDAADAKKTRDTFERDFGLEMKKLFQEALGNDEGAKAVEREQRRQQYIDQAIAAKVDPTRAEELANSRVNLEDAAEAEKERKKKAEDGRKVIGFADSDRSVGLGGFAYAARVDPMLKASQDSTRATTNLTGKITDLIKQLQAKPERVILPGKPVFQ